MNDGYGCNIKDQLVSIDRPSNFSLFQKETYATYDACTHQVVSTYTVPNWNPSFTAMFILFMVAMIIGLMVLDKW